MGFEDDFGDGFGFKFWFFIIFFVVVVLLVFAGTYIIDAGEVGVKLRLGKVVGVEEAGLYVVFPFVESIKKFDIRVKKVEKTVESSSKDLQIVQTTIALNYHIEPLKAGEVYSKLNYFYEDRVIKPSIEECVKSVTAKYTAEELITKREYVRQDIREALEGKLSKFNILIDDVNIVNFDFSEEFNKAIEAKVTAEQLKLKAERDLERIKIEKEQKITMAEAEAKALELQRRYLTKELVELRKIEVLSKLIDKWDGVAPKVLGGAIPLLSVDVEDNNAKNTSEVV